MRFATIISAAVIAVFAAPALSLPSGIDIAARELEARDANEYGLYGRDIYVKPPQRKNSHPFADVRPVQRSREVDPALYKRDMAALLLEARDGANRPKLSITVPANAKPQYGVHAGVVDMTERPWRTGEKRPWRIYNSVKVHA
ncbi:hypothetical protein C8Q72DRAFT_821936 [Fomitopsis betulina]|nr:hypothetical protein C8Q72DRAFT_821936 [Fomitopsis betulina]